jgi:hypothetical protein
MNNDLREVKKNGKNDGYLCWEIKERLAQSDRSKI